MKIIGTAILSRKAIITQRFGSDAWRAFFVDTARAHPFFGQPLAAASLVPIDAFLSFHDALLRRFYGGNQDVYFWIGEESAQWALTAGPYVALVSEQSVAAFAASFPQLWATYFRQTDSSCQVACLGDIVELKAFSLPERHPYFEKVVVGYLKGALELLCANPIEVRRMDESDGANYRYQFDTGTRPPAPLPYDPVQPGRRGHRGDRSSGAVLTGGLSARELQVVRWAACGKTNKEIASLLGISWRTVQNHMSRVYEKIGICSRTGAAAWLMEHDRAEASPQSSISAALLAYRSNKPDRAG